MQKQIQEGIKLKASVHFSLFSVTTCFSNLQYTYGYSLIFNVDPTRHNFLYMRYILFQSKLVEFPVMGQVNLVIL